MQLHVVGSADAFNSAGRGHSCYLLESKAAGRLMVDFGATALAGLRKLGFSPNAVSGIAFTHLHGDHIGGYPFFLIDALFNSGRSEPLELIGPVGTRGSLSALVHAMYGNLDEHISRLSLPLEELEPGGTTMVAGYQVRGFAADHMDPPEQPLCLRITDPAGCSVAFSGDTRLCPGLFAAADGADLCVAECTALKPPAGRHSTYVEWRDAFGEFRGRALALTHLGADVRRELPALLGEAPAPFPVRLLDDGDVLSVER